MFLQEIEISCFGNDYNTNIVGAWANSKQFRFKRPSEVAVTLNISNLRLMIEIFRGRPTFISSPFYNGPWMLLCLIDRTKVSVRLTIKKGTNIKEENQAVAIKMEACWQKASWRASLNNWVLLFFVNYGSLKYCGKYNYGKWPNTSC